MQMNKTREFGKTGAKWKTNTETDGSVLVVAMATHEDECLAVLKNDF